MIDLKFKKLNEAAVIPHYATEGALGLDLTAVSKTKVIHPRDGYLQYISYGTGLSCSLPDGCVGLLVPRSSVTNKNLALGNSCGILDQDYRGEISFRFRKVMDGVNGEYEIGERIGQLVIVPAWKVNVVEVAELDETKRGSGGYGSTDVQSKALKG